jgi:hypothetical protein
VDAVIKYIVSDYTTVEGAANKVKLFEALSVNSEFDRALKMSSDE